MDVDQLNIPVQIANTINAQLAALGISVPLAVTQFFALALCIAALAYGILRLRKEGVKDLLGLLVVVGFGLFSLGIAYAWGEHYLQPLRGTLAGQIDVRDRQGDDKYTGMRVALLNYRGDSIAHEAGFVDSRNGFFALSYDVVLADPPRTLRIEAPDCDTLDFPLTRAKLLAERPVAVPYRCGGGN